MQFESAGKTYYSVMMQACGGYYIEKLSDTATGTEKSSFVKVDEPRYDFTNWSKPSTDVDTVIKVSRATSQIEAMTNFYTKVIEGTVELTKTTNDGTKFVIIKLKNADARIHLVDRPAPAGAKFTVKNLEDFVNATHDKYVKSVNCGFDQHADHHWAYDSMS